MATPTSPINYTEAMLVSLLSTAFDETIYEGLIPVRNGMTDEKRTNPQVICYAQNANTPGELKHWMRNFEVDAVVEIFSKADVQVDDPTTGLAAHRAIVEVLMDRLRDTEAAATIVQADGHKLYEIEPTASSPELEGELRTFGTMINLKVCLVLDLPTPPPAP